LFLAIVAVALPACVFDTRGVGTGGDDDTDDDGPGPSPDARPDPPVPPDAAPPDAEVVICPDEYVAAPAEGVTVVYRFSNGGQGTWFEAVEDCAGDGPHSFLAMPTSDAEVAAIDVLASNKEVWLGFDDTDSEGEFTDLFGEPLLYEHWNAGEPNDLLTLGDEDCVQMLDGGRWNDRDCATTLRWVCECNPSSPGR